jgi:ATP-binding cassette, subfamily G (WHITE), member 2, SNQ2
LFLFSIFSLFIFTVALVMKAWFRAVAAAFGDPAPAQTVAGLMLLTLVLYTGYTIPKPSMIGALKWISYINVSIHQPLDSLVVFMS